MKFVLLLLISSSFQLFEPDVVGVALASAEQGEESPETVESGVSTQTPHCPVVEAGTQANPEVSQLYTPNGSRDHTMWH